MIKTFVLTMVIATNHGITTDHDDGYLLLEDCQAAASAFIVNSDIAAISKSNAWCTTKNVEEKK